MSPSVGLISGISDKCHPPPAPEHMVDLIEIDGHITVDNITITSNAVVSLLLAAIDTSTFSLRERLWLLIRAHAPTPTYPLAVWPVTFKADPNPVWPITFNADSHNDHTVDAVLTPTLSYFGRGPSRMQTHALPAVKFLYLFTSSRLTYPLFPLGTEPEDRSGKEFNYFFWLALEKAANDTSGLVFLTHGEGEQCGWR
ncbi:unnamed protein product [Dibothriocephalus latus]|uniref:Uncharacterized protein n=1 Tax=Dibothriocephalus latus TaxID=60516 RepID=A0A3P7P5U3_DIBLA|nr:unnamed protein product [Dibothriocephalus latus]